MTAASADRGRGVGRRSNGAKSVAAVAAPAGGANGPSRAPHLAAGGEVIRLGQEVGFAARLLCCPPVTPHRMGAGGPHWVRLVASGGLARAWWGGSQHLVVQGQRAFGRALPAERGGPAKTALNQLAAPGGAAGHCEDPVQQADF